MKCHRFLSTLAALQIAVSLPALAQNRGPGMEHRFQALTDTVVTRLALSGDTEKAFRAIMDEQQQGMKKIFEDYQGRRDPQMREDMMALRQATDAKLATVLSKDQMKQLHELRTELRSQMRDRGHQARQGDSAEQGKPHDRPHP